MTLPQRNGTHDDAEAASVGGMARPIAAILDEALRLSLQMNPEHGAMLDYPLYQDDIFHSAPEEHMAFLTSIRRIEQEAKAIDPLKLSTADRDAREFLLIDCETMLLESHDLEIPATHMYGGFCSIDQNLTQLQKMDSAKDANNYLLRLKKFPERFANDIARFRIGIEHGVTLPLESIQLMIRKCENLSNCKPEESMFTKTYQGKFADFGISADTLVGSVRENVLPAYRTMHDFLANEYIQHARKGDGIYGMPNYKKVYDNRIYAHTTVKMTADELHALGLAEVARIRARMEEVKDQVYSGTFSDFLKALKDPSVFPNLYFKTEEEYIQLYKSMLDRINKKMPEYFNRQPKFACEIKTVPEAISESAPIAYYMPGTPTKAGTFFANFKMSMNSPVHTAMALTLHEAIPGHHHQLSISFETNSLHDFMKMSLTTAYAEGWGLYSEFLGEEMGMYDTPFDLFGRLELEMHRAIRLVVDTGLHSKGWTIDQCVKIMAENLAMSESEIMSEVKRYMIIPGQALAYKVGEIKMREVRRMAEDSLGDAFDIRAFHDVILDYGSVHMATLERHVREWVDSVKAANTMV